MTPARYFEQGEATTREWTASDLGRAFDEALAAAEQTGWCRPALMPVTEGWEASTYRRNGSRRFTPRLSETRRSPEQALLALADRMRGAVETCTWYPPCANPATATIDGRPFCDGHSGEVCEQVRRLREMGE